MNTFHDLLHRYATADNYTINRREWLMLLELDPVRAARAMTHLVILAAEDLTLQYAEHALDAILAAGQRPGPSAAAGHTAATQIAAFTERITAARATAAGIWAETIVPLLRDADVLHEAHQPAAPTYPPRTWTDTLVRRPGGDRTYPAQVAIRRRRLSRPIVRFDLDTCLRLATDLTDQPLPPLILVDHDRPVLVLGAPDLEQAWRADAHLVHPDRDGYFHLGDRRRPCPRHRHDPPEHRTMQRRPGSDLPCRGPPVPAAHRRRRPPLRHRPHQPR